MFIAEGKLTDNTCYKIFYIGLFKHLVHTGLHQTPSLDWVLLLVEVTWEVAKAEERDSPASDGISTAAMSEEEEEEEDSQEEDLVAMKARPVLTLCVGGGWGGGSNGRGRRRNAKKRLPRWPQPSSAARTSPPPQRHPSG